MKLTKQYIKSLIKEELGLEHTETYYRVISPSADMGMDRVKNYLESPVTDPKFMDKDFTQPVTLHFFSTEPSNRWYIFSVVFNTKNPDVINRTKERIKGMLDKKQIEQVNQEFISNFKNKNLQKLNKQINK